MAATDGFWADFRRWRRRRPFWGSLLMLLSGLELLYAANMDLGDLQIHVGPQGFLSYVVPAILLLCALLALFTPAQRLFYGIVGVLAALYSFIGLNLGGFFLGMLLGIIGGALIIAWGPPRNRPARPAGPPAGEPGDHQQDGPVDVGDDIFGTRQDIDETQRIEIAGHDDRPREHQPIRPAGQAPAELLSDEPRRATGLQRLGRNPRAVVLGLVPVVATAALVAIGSTLPASADDECPAGLPSRTATTTATASPTTEPATAATTTAAAAATTPTAATTTTTTAATPTTAATTAATTEDSDGNAITDGIENFVDGVSNLLGIGDDESASPSTSPASSESSATPEPTATTTTTATADPTTTTEPTKAETTDPGGTTTTTTAATATATATDDVIPCLGPRVYGLTDDPDGIPYVAAKPGLMEVDLLTMYNSTYDGVVDMPVQGGGSYKALKFSMDKAVNKPFSLTIDEANGGQTVTTSAELTTTGTVKFYTSRFEGKLFGLIPVVFTPDQPPPLTLPVLWFTDAKIQLSFVRCDTLTGDPLRVQEKG